jgi:hypothetical protein
MAETGWGNHGKKEYSGAGTMVDLWRRERTRTGAMSKGEWADD